MRRQLDLLHKFAPGRADQKAAAALQHRNAAGLLMPNAARGKNPSDEFAVQYPEGAGGPRVDASHTLSRQQCSMRPSFHQATYAQGLKRLQYDRERVSLGPFLHHFPLRFCFTQFAALTTSPLIRPRREQRGKPLGRFCRGHRRPRGGFGPSLPSAPLPPCQGGQEERKSEILLNHAHIIYHYILYEVY